MENNYFIVVMVDSTMVNSNIIELEQSSNEISMLHSCNNNGIIFLSHVHSLEAIMHRGQDYMNDGKILLSREKFDYQQLISFLFNVFANVC